MLGEMAKWRAVSERVESRVWREEVVMTWLIETRTNPRARCRWSSSDINYSQIWIRYTGQRQWSNIHQAQRAEKQVYRRRYAKPAPPPPLTKPQTALGENETIPTALEKNRRQTHRQTNKQTNIRTTSSRISPVLKYWWHRRKMPVLAISAVSRLVSK